MRESPTVKTARAVREVRSIDDIVAIESGPYDENVPARSLYQLLSATAALHPDRPALTVLEADSLAQLTPSQTHSELLFEVTRAANLFTALHAGRKGVVAILCPTLAEIPVALLAAQVTGIASTINYLLSVD